MSETADEEIRFQRQNVVLLMDRIRALEAELARTREYESLALSEAEARGKAEAERDALRARVAELGDFYVHHQGVCKDCHCEHVGGGRESGGEPGSSGVAKSVQGPGSISPAAANPAADEPCEHGIFDCEECGG